MRIICALLAILICAGCSVSDKIYQGATPEELKQGAAFVSDALVADEADLAKPVAKEVSKKLGEPKERLPVTAENSAALTEAIPEGKVPGWAGLSLLMLLLVPKAVSLAKKFLPV